MTDLQTDWVRNGSKYLRCFRNEKQLEHSPTMVNVSFWDRKNFSAVNFQAVQRDEGAGGAWWQQDSISTSHHSDTEGEGEEQQTGSS